MKAMRKRQNIWILGTLACALSAARGQDTTAAPAPQASPQQPVAPSAPPTPTVNENPPLTGLDLPSLEAHETPVSYFKPGATFSESADSNAGASLNGGSSFTSVSRALGSASLRRLWSHYDFAVDYEGGIGYYDRKGIGLKSLQQSDAQQKVTWKRGQFSVRDSFSYLPEGNFGGSYGSLGSQEIGSLGNTAFGSFFGGSSLGSLGLVPRILNVSLADFEESLTPKSSVTATGGYAVTHFFGTDVNTGTAYLGSSQISGQVGYDRILSAHTQVAVSYGYQGFDFSVFGTAFHSNVIEFIYGHRVSGRMDLLVAAGPQFTQIGTACSELEAAFMFPPECHQGANFQPEGTIPTSRIGVAGQIRLRYKFTNTDLSMRYERFETSGSGIFAGAQSDIVRISANRRLNRVWSGFVDLGYSHNVREQSLSQAQLGTCLLPGQTSSQPPPPPCPGLDAHAFTTGFAGVGVHRAFGREWHGFATYQFNVVGFDHSYCGVEEPCSRISNRSVVTIGLDWTPRPIRID